MKKLIAISVVFALVAGAAFAVDLSANVTGAVNVIKAESTAGSRVTADGSFKALNLEGAGELADGKFGGWIRLDSGEQAYWGAGIWQGLAWWKPIDQLKVQIGKFMDGKWGKDGIMGWNFYQVATDVGVTFGGDHAWGGGFSNYNIALPGINMGAVCGEGFTEGLFLEITPVDMVAINIGLPFFSGGNIEEVFKSTYAQLALNMSFGTIAFTFTGNTTLEASRVSLYFGLTAIENLNIDFGLGSNFDNKDMDSDRLNLGLGVKYSQDSWGIKFRSMFAVPIASGMKLGMLFDVLPYFVINDNLRIFVSGGVAIYNVSKIEDGANWHVNPYIEVGEDWGPRFFAGLKVSQNGNLKSGGGAPVVFSLPIAIAVTF